MSNTTPDGMLRLPPEPPDEPFSTESAPMIIGLFQAPPDIKIPPFALSSPVPATPPLVMVVAPLTLMFPEPDKVPLEIAKVDMETAVLNVAVPPTTLIVPPSENAPAIVVVPEAKRAPPAPVTLDVAVRVFVVPENSMAAPEATVNELPLVMFENDMAPTWISTVPALLKAMVDGLVVVPDPLDLRIVPLLLTVPVPEKAASD